MADVLVLGATSMVGSHFVQHGKSTCSALGRKDPRTEGIRVERFARADLEDPETMRRAILAAPEPSVVNFAALTDVDAIERERPPTLEAAGGRAWSVNAIAPGSVAEAARTSGKFFVQLSTDFVFDGTGGPYAEEATRSPFSSRMSWYGWTKSEGERRAFEADPDASVIRISYPYRGEFPFKIDFARRIIARHRDGTLPPMFTDQEITPTWVPDVTTALDAVLRLRSPRVLHVASPASTTPFEFASELLARLDGHRVEISPSRLADSTRDPHRAPRPIRGGLSTQRAAGLGLELTDWRGGIDRLVAEARR